MYGVQCRRILLLAAVASMLLQISVQRFVHDDNSIEEIVVRNIITASAVSNSNGIDNSTVVKNESSQHQSLGGRDTVESTATTTAAICHRALFGTPDLHRVRHWVDYHHHLGFGHAFLWYLPGIDALPGFQELLQLPYVTMQVENIVTDDGTVQTNTWKNVNQEHASQRRLILQCLNQDAHSYDWIMFADADEFLWFHTRLNLQTFLRQHHNMTYLSFGKYEYTVSHSVAATTTIETTSVESSNWTTELFGGLGRFAFTAGSYCRPPTTRKKRGLAFGDPYCPANRGRSKVILQPKHYNYTDIHGISKNPRPADGMLHFHTDVARFNEFVGMHVDMDPKIVKEPFQDFLILDTEKVSVHQPKRSFRPNAEGTYTMTYDDSLQPWMEFVGSLDPPR